MVRLSAALSIDGRASREHAAIPGKRMTRFYGMWFGRRVAPGDGSLHRDRLAFRAPEKIGALLGRSSRESAPIPSPQQSSIGRASITLELTVTVPVEVDITKGLFCNRRALDEEADVEFVGHPDAAVHLNPFAADTGERLADLGL